MKSFKKLGLFTLLASMLVVTACGGGTGQPSGQGDAQTGGGTTQAPAAPEKTYKFKMTHVTQTSHVWHMFGEKLAEELETRSEGRMKMDIFPASQLGPEKDMVQQLETGSIEFALLTGPYLSTRFQSLNGWNIPFLFPNLEASLAATKLNSAQKMLEPLSTQGLHPFGYMFAGNHNLLMKSKPVASMEDVKGQNIRVTGGPILTDFWTQAGASAVSMGLTEVYSALQTGVIDGTSMDASGLYTEKLHEIADHFILTNHMAFSGVVVASKKVYDEMPEADRKIVDEAVQAAIEWGQAELLRLDKENVELLRKEIEVTELKDASGFEKIRDQVIEKYATDELIKQFITEVREQQAK